MHLRKCKLFGQVFFKWNNKTILNDDPDQSFGLSENLLRKGIGRNGEID